MNILMVSDLHLTDRPKDVYRWKLFTQLIKIIKERKVSNLFILGDLTDAKDFHSSVLVNKVVDALLKVLNETDVKTIYILRGNHDGIDPTLPYFKFLNAIPQIKLIIKPNTQTVEGVHVALLPHTRTPMQDWTTPAINKQVNQCDILLMHATLGGAVSESGHVLDGLHQADIESLFDTARIKIYSGDVHVPQKLGPITYVGAPYPVRFGDKFTPRALLLEIDKRIKETTIVLPNLRRVYAEVSGAVELDSTRFGIRKGDQLKVGLKLNRSEFVEWKERKEQIIAWCQTHEVDLCKLNLVKADKPLIKRGLVTAQQTDTSTQGIFKTYCAEQKLDEQYTEIGQFLLETTGGQS